MLRAVLAHNLTACTTMMLSLGETELWITAIALRCALIGRPVVRQLSARHLLGNFRLFLQLRDLQFWHAQLNAELFKSVLVFVVLLLQLVVIGAHFVMLLCVFAVLTDLQLKFRYQILVLELFRLQSRSPFPLDPQISFASTATLFAHHNLRWESFRRILEGLEWGEIGRVSGRV